MPIAPSQVVGLIEIDGERQAASDHPLGPVARSSRQGYAPTARWNQPLPAHRVETVTADLDQLNDDLHVELACIVSRIAKQRRK